MSREKKREIHKLLSSNTKEPAKGNSVTYKIKFIDSVIINQSNLTDYLAQGLHKSKRKDCKSCFEYVNTRDGSFIFKCSDCNQIYEKKS